MYGECDCLKDKEIEWLEMMLGGSVCIEEVVPPKKTARCPRQIIISRTDIRNQKWLVVKGESRIQFFFIEHAITMQLKYGKLFDGFCINYPIAYIELQGAYLAIYSWIENVEFVQDGYPVEFMRRVYKKKIKRKNSIELVNTIEENYLKVWPEFIRERIKKTPIFLLWDNELKK